MLSMVILRVMYRNSRCDKIYISVTGGAGVPAPSGGQNSFLNLLYIHSLYANNRVPKFTKPCV